jgi:hypothetical protein
MATKDATVGAAPFFKMGGGQAEAEIALHREILDFYEPAGRAWLERVQSEVAMWTELATKLTATRSILEAIDTYAKYVSQRLQMAAEEGRRLAEESHQITQKITQAFAKGWPVGNT